jgi:hypothetical protein
MKLLRKALIWTHRYLGIVVSALFLMWFLTGVGMIWTNPIRSFGALYYSRPTWDAVVIVLSLGGAAISGIGLLVFERALPSLQKEGWLRH